MGERLEMRIAETARWVFLALFLSISIHAQNEVEVTAESRQKALFLYNFSKLIVWPAEAFTETDNRIVFGFLGGRRMDDLAKFFDGRTTQGHPIHVKLIQDVNEAGLCHLLFIGAAHDNQKSVLESLGGKPVLTVGESPRFLDDGGVINFLVEGDKILFEINAVAASRANLKVSSSLLTLARRIQR